MPGRFRALVATLAAAAALGGCGLGPGPGTRQVTLTVTEDFGAHAIGAVSDRRVPGAETVMRMLERSFTVGTRYGGGFVQSIDGHAGSSDQHDWFYYVNGVEAARGAAATNVHRGDQIWFDLHDWHATDSVPAVVGSFPEPFRHGIGGKRYPVTVQCASGLDRACAKVSAALTAAGIPSASQGFGTGSGEDTLAVVVATWRQVAGAVGANLIAHGPQASGVYARFAHVGHALQLLNPAGSVVSTLGAGAGLIAATADQNSVPTWLVTGTDAAGVTAAAAAMTPSALHDHFALAVTTTRRIPVPVAPGS
ncbi:MAG TPA: DUF4430 domain-containing protein [Solirubrobacteraceae bacterium]|nr:DUF4430 domain-containing protein [Solirubrobacteraceae bacterium]